MAIWYHAITEYHGDKKRYWWNRDRDGLVEELLIPLLSKQVVLVPRREKKALFNFSSVSYATILGTADKLSRRAKGQPPEELTDRVFVSAHDVTDEFVEEVRHLSSNSAVRSILMQGISQPTNQMFVVMKYDDDALDSAYEGVVKPLAKSFGYKALRADEIENSGKISQQILESVAHSKIIFAELSGARPNTYYETGYAHALGKEMIITMKGGEKPHFDLADHRYIPWNTEQELREKLRKRLNAITSRDEGD